jgi:arylsulfatase A-like enzyme
MQRLRLQPGIGHFPNLPSQQFKGKSRIGNHGDKLMEGDYHVGQILDTLKQLGIDDNTIVVFASDNGPQGETAREHGNQGTPDMGNSAPFRGELGEVTEGAIRTAANHPLARQGQAEHNHIRHVLDHGLPADLRPHRRRQDANGPTD